MRGLPQGERDTALYRYACHLAGCRVPLDLAVSFMATAAERCQPPFDPQIAREKVIRAYSNVGSKKMISEAISKVTQELDRRKEAIV